MPTATVIAVKRPAEPRQLLTSRDRETSYRWNRVHDLGYTPVPETADEWQGRIVFGTASGIARMASNLSKNMVFGSFGVAGFIALLALLDMIVQVPFAGSTLMDVLFIISAGIVGYLGWDAYKDMS